MGKIFCPKHEDTNPSCEVYEDGAYCFSGCGQISLAELGFEGQASPPKPKEDVEKSLEQIKRLSIGRFRGFDFPCDFSGFYITWPNAPFYKKRLFDPKAKNKYLGPSGHKPPLFWARNQGSNTLACVEGELEALSLAEAVKSWDVVSPGSASSFESFSLVKACSKYGAVLLFVDNDPAGIKAAQSLTTLLVDSVPKIVVSYKDKEQDFNKILCEQGVLGLSSEVEKVLSRGVCWENPR